MIQYEYSMIFKRLAKLSTKTILLYIVCVYIYITLNLGQE